MNQFSQNFWAEKNVLVTGGASFIGSHLVDKLISLGASVSVADDLSTGKMDNLEGSKEKINFICRSKTACKQFRLRCSFSGYSFFSSGCGSFTREKYSSQK